LVAVFSKFSVDSGSSRYLSQLGRQRQVWLIAIADWMCGCGGKTVRSLKITCHIWVFLRWWFTKRL